MNLNLNNETRTVEKSVEKIDGVAYAVTTITTTEKRYVKLDTHQALVDAQIAKLQAEKADVIAKAELAVEAVKEEVI